MIGMQRNLVEDPGRRLEKIGWDHTWLFLKAHMKVLDFIPLAMISHFHWRRSGFQKDNFSVEYKRY